MAATQRNRCLPHGRRWYFSVVSLFQAPLPCTYRGKYRASDHSGEDLGLKYAKDVLNIINQAHSDGRRIAAFICESLVSCGGQLPLPDNYLRNAYK